MTLLEGCIMVLHLESCNMDLLKESCMMAMSKEYYMTMQEGKLNMFWELMIMERELRSLWRISRMAMRSQSFLD